MVLDQQQGRHSSHQVKILPENPRRLLLTEPNKLERTLMCSSDDMLQREKNPAYGASRGLNEARVHSGSYWFQGPPFLW